MRNTKGGCVVHSLRIALHQICKRMSGTALHWSDITFLVADVSTRATDGFVVHNPQFHAF